MRFKIEIFNYGAKYGYKSANLMFLEKELKKYRPSIDYNLKVEVPAFLAISNDDIVNHLALYAPDWQNIWHEFVTIYKKQESDPQTISSDAEYKLIELQEVIKKCFNQHPLEGKYLKELSDKILLNDLLMVRSTGKEDSTEIANPGGNESKACVEFTTMAISNAVGEVIASYFSIKSLSQRLKAGDDITVFPICPVLIQKMIDEKTKNHIVYSGVIYSNNGNTRIQAAPGHGELIVNSKGNFDNYYITSENVVYAEISAKHFRLAPKYNNQTNTTDLGYINNDNHLKYSSSLNEDTALILHQLARHLEKEYGMRMDIEFIYDPNTKTINIVQARPIPLGDRKNLQPSATTIEFIDEIKKGDGEIISGQIITPEVMRAAVVTDPRTIIICDTIEEALSIYLKHSNTVKAVIVKQNAPDTSHEAGEFSSKAIPVIQIDDLKQAQKLLSQANANHPVIIDPQRKKILLPAQRLLPQFDKSSNIEEILYSSNKIKEGIFKSTLTAHVTPYKYNFNNEYYQFYQDIISEIKTEELGTLLHKIRSGDEKAKGKLLSFLFHIINSNQVDTTIDSYKSLMEHLETLSTPKFGGSNEAKKQALNTILKLLFNLRKQDSLSIEVFTQVMLTAGELYLTLEKLEQAAYNEGLLLEYLNILEKFTGSITAERRKDILSESVFTELSEKQHKITMDKWLVDSNLSIIQKEYFYEVSKLAKFIINPALKQLWYNFCKELCKSDITAARLGKMVAILVESDLHESWVNFSFIPAFQQNGYDSKKTITMLYPEVEQIITYSDKFQPAYRLIQSMEAQISAWKEPNNFTKLYPEFIKNLEVISQELVYENEAPLMAKMLVLKYMEELVDTLDKTIKSLEKSTLYAEEVKSLQVERFYLLLEPFNKLMKQWGEYASFSKDSHIFQAMDDFLKSKRNSHDAKELSPSGSFAVNAAIIGTPGSFFRNFTNKPNKTLEDIFTLIHQNSIQLISMLSQGYNNIILSTAPKILQEITHQISKLSKNLDAGRNNVVVAVIPPILVYIKSKYPEINLFYNIPLRNHSGSLEIKYNYTQNNFIITCFMFGHNSENRWNKIALITYLENIINGIEMLSMPHYNPDNQQLHFSLKLNNITKIDSALHTIRQVMAFSFLTVSGATTDYMEMQVRSSLKQLNNFSIEQVLKFKRDFIECITNTPSYCLPYALLTVFKTINNILNTFKYPLNNNINSQVFYDLISAYDKNFKISELDSLTESEMLWLCKRELLWAYQQGYFGASNLINIDNHEIREACTTFDALNSYQNNYLDINFLKSLNKYQILALTSNDALYAYELGLNYKSLMDSNTTLGKDIKLQITLSLINYYNIDKITANDLEDLDNDAIVALSSPTAIKLYNGYTTFHILKSINNDKRTALLSKNTLTILQDGLIKFNELQALEVDIIILLTSNNTLFTLYNNYLSLEDIINLPKNDLEIVTSLDFKIVSDSTKIPFLVLKELSPQLLEVLATYPERTRTYFVAGYNKIEDFKKLDLEVLRYLLSWEAIIQCKLKFNDFIGLNLKEATIKIIINLAAASINNPSIEADYASLLHNNSYFYKAKKLFLLGIEINDLNKLDMKIVQYVLSKKGADNLKLDIRVKDFLNNLNKINSRIQPYILSKNINYIYSLYNTFGNFADEINKLDIKIVQYLLLDKVSDIYTLGVKFSDFKNLKLHQVKYKIAVILTNHYSQGSNITEKDISKLDSDIRMLFFDPDCAIAAYKTGYVKFEDLKDLESEEMIELLISEAALELYKRKVISIAELKKLESDQAKLVIDNLTELTHVSKYKLSGLDICLAQYLINENKDTTLHYSNDYVYNSAYNAIQKIKEEVRADDQLARLELAIATSYKFAPSGKQLTTTGIAKTPQNLTIPGEELLVKLKNDFYIRLLSVDPTHQNSLNK